jgi:protein-tyrosine phosphatase
MITEIINKLWLGGYDDAIDGAALKRNGITAVLNVTKETLPIKHFEGIQYINVGLSDDHLNDWRIIKLILKIMKHLIYNGETILIHCAAGISRSPFMVALYLKEHYGCSLDKAYKLLKEKYIIADEETPLKSTKELKLVYET